MVKHVPQATLEQAKAYIDQGNVGELGTLLTQYPELCASRNDDEIPPTLDNALMLYATSWPGGRPNGLAIIRLLIEHGAEPKLRNNGTGETVLHWSASTQSDVENIDVLVDGGADVDCVGGVICQGTPLMNALYFGLPVNAERLLARGAEVCNLISAAGCGDTDLIESWHMGGGVYARDAVCISRDDANGDGSILDEQTTKTWTYRAVICALMCQQYHVVDWFLDHGFDLEHIPADVDWSCLHHAAYIGSLPMAMYLVAKGANLDIEESHHATPADYASAHGHPEAMNYLVDAGTSTSLASAASKGRLDKIVQGYAQCEDRLALLLETIGSTTVIGKPVHASIQMGRVAVARYLIQREPDLVGQYVNGKTVISIAKERDDQELLALVGALSKS